MIARARIGRGETRSTSALVRPTDKTKAVIAFRFAYTRGITKADVYLEGRGHNNLSLRKGREKYSQAGLCQSRGLSLRNAGHRRRFIVAMSIEISRARATMARDDRIVGLRSGSAAVPAIGKIANPPGHRRLRLVRVEIVKLAKPMCQHSANLARRSSLAPTIRCRCIHPHSFPIALSASDYRYRYHRCTLNVGNERLDDRRLSRDSNGERFRGSPRSRATCNRPSRV